MDAQDARSVRHSRQQLGTPTPGLVVAPVDAHKHTRIMARRFDTRTRTSAQRIHDVARCVMRLFLLAGVAYHAVDCARNAPPQSFTSTHVAVTTFDAGKQMTTFEILPTRHEQDVPHPADAHERTHHIVDADFTYVHIRTLQNVVVVWLVLVRAGIRMMVWGVAWHLDDCGTSHARIANRTASVLSLPQTVEHLWQDENVAAPPLTPFFEPIAQTASKLTMLVYLQGPQMI